ncbi:hypothetical protein OS493_005550 [Desmophyllum pertusum]|uniref:Uncharacterized protein n=1 Tax=Desmophyllum pertusum TaxID=174260 RepID=A0A9X0CNS3_9CNID|nr:hypothetical protein OS493_005550 [Desmophyllum pertusum]
MDSSVLLQKHKLVKKAIPNIVNAIKTVVSLSKNEDFKENASILSRCTGNITTKLYSYCTKTIVHCGTPERSKLLPVTEVVPDITSPKAKLRCRKNTLASTGETISSNSDWLQEFSQDCFWIANDKSLVKQESETCPKTLKDKVDCYAEQQAPETTNVIEYAFQGSQKMKIYF